MLRIKRRRYLVAKAMQLRYMGLVIVPLVIALSGLYYLMYFTVLNQILVPEGIVAMLLPAMKKVNTVLIFSLPVILFFILRAALIYSHRIVGPIPRIEKEIDKVLAGGYSLRLKVRDKDELSNFVRKVNLLLEKVEGDRCVK